MILAIEKEKDATKQPVCQVAGVGSGVNGVNGQGPLLDKSKSTFHYITES